ncbi:MAG TPA: hypothetical protein VH912_22000 [Streptosporangiaceae bacterium]|jgi:RNA-splicing ligase RtcB
MPDLHWGYGFPIGGVDSAEGRGYLAAMAAAAKTIPGTAIPPTRSIRAGLLAGRG